jgi:hypothetical protein
MYCAVAVELLLVTNTEHAVLLYRKVKKSA